MESKELIEMVKELNNTADNVIGYDSGYALSNRSKCKFCHEKIVKFSLRIGEEIRISSGRELTKWYHSQCFYKESLPRGVYNGDIGSIVDIDKETYLSKADRLHIDSRIKSLEKQFELYEQESSNDDVDDEDENTDNDTDTDTDETDYSDANVNDSIESLI